MRRFYTAAEQRERSEFWTERTAGTPAKMEWRRSLDGTGPEWELIASPPTGRTQVVQTENSGHQHYGAAFTCPPGQPGCVSAMGTPDPDNTQMGPKGERPTAEDYAEPWDANQTAPDYTDYSGLSGVGTGGGTGGGGSWGGSSSSGGGSTGGGSVGAGGIMDVSQSLHDLYKSKYPDVEIGGYRPGGDGFDEHNRGSLDIMHPERHGIDPNWAMQEAFNAGAPWAIYNQTMHYPDSSRNYLMPDRGDPTQNHFDHIHTGPLMGT